MKISLKRFFTAVTFIAVTLTVKTVNAQLPNPGWIPDSGPVITNTIHSGFLPLSFGADRNGQNTKICQSDNGQYSLWIQQDGNFVLYHNGKGIWSTGVINSGNYTNWVTFTADGRIVVSTDVEWNLSTSKPIAPKGTIKYDSWLREYEQFHWILQDDGNFVRYRNSDRASISTRTHGGKNRQSGVIN